MEWLDTIKLTIPFVAAILMVWIKTTIERLLTRKYKQLALSRLIGNELGELPDAVNAVKRIAESAANNKIRLVSIDVSTLTAKFCFELADLDTKHAYVYCDLSSAIEIANKGISRLTSFIEKRAVSDGEKVTGQLDRSIIGQSKILASDFVSIGKASLEVIKIIPAKYRYGDHQAISSLEKAITSAENIISAWPTYATQASIAEQSC